MRSNLLLAFLLCLSCTLAAKLRWFELDYSYKFETYLEHYGKRYHDRTEHNLRKGIFENNLHKVIAHNKDATKTWKEEINHFSDWTPEELRSILGYDKKVGYAQKARAVPTQQHALKVSNGSLPDTVDWRASGIVTPIKDQGRCGSCWSFAAAETIESLWALKYGVLWELSEQQILDCTSNPNHCGGTGGCGGGTAEVAYSSIATLGGLASEWTYPYLSHNGTDFPKCGIHAGTPPVVNFTSYVTLPTNEYMPLLKASASVGPLAISVDASTWFSYSTGVYNGCNQTNPDINHAVQLVGYGTEDGMEYWLVRNSWTPAWGEGGYIKLLRPSTVQCGTDLYPSDGDGCDNGPSTVTVCGTCGILYDSSYPIV